MEWMFLLCRTGPCVASARSMSTCGQRRVTRRRAGTISCGVAHRPCSRLLQLLAPAGQSEGPASSARHAVCSSPGCASAQLQQGPGFQGVCVGEDVRVAPQRPNHGQVRAHCRLYQLYEVGTRLILPGLCLVDFGRCSTSVRRRSSLRSPDASPASPTWSMCRCANPPGAVVTLCLILTLLL